MTTTPTETPSQRPGALPITCYLNATLTTHVPRGQRYLADGRPTHTALAGRTPR